MNTVCSIQIVRNICLIALLVAVVGCGGDREVKKLISDLRDDTAEDRHDAAKALENLGVRAVPAVSALAQCLSDEDAQVRYRAAKTLAKLGRAAKGAVIELGTAMANDPDEKVKYYSAKAIVEIADQEPEAVMPVVPDLVKSLNVTDPKTRYYVVKALGKLGAGASDAVEAMEELVDDSDKAVREAAASAIRRIKKKHSES